MKRYKLLPEKFRIAGIVLIVLAYVVPVTMGMLHLFPQLSNWKQDLSKTGLLLGLLLIALTRQKVEDEFVNSCRLLSMFNAFIVTIIFYLGTTIIPLVSIQVISYSGFRVLFTELFIYLFSFHIAVRGGLSGHDK